MNRKDRRNMGSKMTKAEFGDLLANVEKQFNGFRQQVQTLDGDVDTLMTMLMSTKLTGTDEVKKLDTIALGFMGRLKKEDGTLEDLPFQGGVAQYMLIKRFDNGEFIPGFEEKMKGMKVGETRTIEVQFPKNYHEHLKEKTAVFEVVVIAGWRLNESISYIDTKIQELFKAKAEKDKAAREAAKAAEAPAEA
jgi:FKBP-type peptidyl-prolyl cis-trans isomerase